MTFLGIDYSTHTSHSALVSAVLPLGMSRSYRDRLSRPPAFGVVVLAGHFLHIHWEPHHEMLQFLLWTVIRILKSKKKSSGFLPRRVEFLLLCLHSWNSKFPPFICSPGVSFRGHVLVPGSQGSLHVVTPSCLSLLKDAPANSGLGVLSALWKSTLLLYLRPPWLLMSHLQSFG